MKYHPEEPKRFLSPLNSNQPLFDMNKYRGTSLLLFACTLTLLPLSVQSQSLMSVIQNRPSLSSFAEALQKSGIDQRLEGQGPYTVFAPSNNAFNKEIAGKDLSSSSVRSTLMNHIMTGYATERNMKIMSKAKSMGGITLSIETSGNSITINDVVLTSVNIKADNGVLHIISGVLK